MTANHDKSKGTIFSRQLNKKLEEKYHKKPFATTFANHFNLNTHGDKTISSETARRWMSGESKPRLDTILHLCNWLQINPDVFFMEESKDNMATTGNGFDALAENSKLASKAMLLKSYEGLNANSLKTILDFMGYLKQNQNDGPQINHELNDLSSEEIIDLIKKS